MRGLWRKTMSVLLVASLSCSLAGCTGKKDNHTKDKPAATASMEAEKAASAQPQGKIKASGKGNNKSDVPLVVGCKPFEKQFNPFLAVSQEDAMAVKLTQVSLLTVDREGALVNRAITGETRHYNGEDYTYTGAANMKVTYDKKSKETRYLIRLRDDMVFSDGKPVTVDDVIFSMYAFADSSYQGCESFGELPIKGLEKYRSGDSKKEHIAGIERIDDARIRLTMKGYDRDAIYALNIPICPLHYYGDKNQYNGKSRFGFPKGDISGLIKKKNSPTGAGAYKFIKYESGIIYYEANDKYYKGCPPTAFIQLKEIKDGTTEHKIEMLAEGDVDVVNLEGDNGAVMQILETNSSGKLNGGTISTRLYDGDRYAYIGINAQTVCVDDKPDSTRSKYLRKGLATLLASNRYETVSTRVQGAKVINYPASDTSWSVPQTGDEEYTGAFVMDKNSQVIYSSEMNVPERQRAACKAALGYLKLAGYTVKKGEVTAAPEGSSKTFRVLVPQDTDSGRAMYMMMTEVKTLFEQIGLQLKVTDTLSEQEIQRKLQKGKQQIWCGFADTRVNGSLYQMFYSSDSRDKEAGSENYFHISDSDLDEYIEETLVTPGLKKSIHLYGKCYEKIMDWAVEVPFYQEREISIFSSSRINMETIAADITSYYGWMDELQNVEMK